MMDGEPQSRIKAVNDAIIGNREEDVIAYKRRAVSIDTLDTMQQIDVSMPIPETNRREHGKVNH